MVRHRQQSAEMAWEANRHVDRAAWLEQAVPDGWILEQDPNNAAVKLRVVRAGPSFAPVRPSPRDGSQQ